MARRHPDVGHPEPVRRVERVTRRDVRRENHGGSEVAAVRLPRPVQVDPISRPSRAGWAAWARAPRYSRCRRGCPACRRAGEAGSRHPLRRRRSRPPGMPRGSRPRPFAPTGPGRGGPGGISTHGYGSTAGGRAGVVSKTPTSTAAPSARPRTRRRPARMPARELLASDRDRTTTLTLRVELLPESSVHRTVIVYTRPLPPPDRSARSWTFQVVDDLPIRRRVAVALCR